MFFIQLILILSLVLCGNLKKIREEYGPQPKIYVENGHLHISVPEDKDIHFESSKIMIDNVDILTTLLKANNATKLLSTYQNTFSTYVTRIDDLESRLQSSESDSRNVILGNTTGASLDTMYFDNAITRINRRIGGIQKGLLRLNALLIANECGNNPCKNGGLCTDVFNGFLCNCLSGWEGTTCEIDVNECARFAGTDLGCQNGATCVNKQGTYECLCERGWVGLHCTRKTVDCNSGGTELCGHGTCIPQNNEAGYKCLCDQGWTTDGTNSACSRDVDECKLNHQACSTNPLVPCINVPGSFYCGSCPQGYTGNGYYCVDIDECAIFNGGCSQIPMVQCVNTPGSKICGPCPPGYSGNGLTCSYRGVCNVNNGGCNPLAQCRDNPGISSTFVECICPPDMVGNGIGPTGCRQRPRSATPCTPNPCQNGGDCVVNNSTGDFLCQCRTMYIGRNCEIYLNACDANVCLNGGTCIPLASGHFRCQCEPGFSGEKCQKEPLACGGILTRQNGNLTFPPKDFQEITQSGFSCAWTIKTNSSSVLIITIKKFHLGDSGTCRENWLQLNDGRNTGSTLLGRFCGTKLPLGGNITTTQNILTLWFKGDRNARPELELEWASAKASCGAIIENSSHGKIESPGSPGNYPNDRECHWTLIAPPGKRFLFHFYQLSIGNNSDCSHDYLKFYNLRFVLGGPPMFASYCNSTSLPSPLHSPNSEVDLVFHSDSKDSYPGFQITYSVVEGIPGCGGVYTSRRGVIQSVPRDNMTSKLECEYQIRLPESSKIKLTFLEMNLESALGCDNNYVKIFEGSNTSSSSLGTYCGSSLPGPYVSRTNLITLLSSMLDPKSKWKIQYELVCYHKFTNTRGSFNYTNYGSESCVYEIEVPLGHYISVTMQLSLNWINRSSVGCIKYIEVRNGNSETSPLLGQYCASEKVTVFSHANYMWIKVRGHIHFSSFFAEYRDYYNGCGGILTKKIGRISFPLADNARHYYGYKCRFLIIAPPQNVIQLTWMTFNIDQSIECLNDYVQIFDNDSAATDSSMGRFCGHTLPPVLLSSSNMVTVIYGRKSYSGNGNSFLAAYTFIQESNVCGGNYFTTTGVIKSPGYPKPYPVNKECKWTITVEPGTQILLNVTDFNLEAYSSCRYDWLEIRNGGTSASPLIGKFCGTTIPKVIPAHANQLYLVFNSDMSRTAPGFKIKWTSTTTGCGGTLTSPSGSIISPYYPEPYNKNADCLWKIVINTGSIIQATFSDIDLERHTSCGLDYVEFFDGLEKNSKSLGKYCSTVDGSIKSTSNKMLVRFKSNISSQGRGFQLQYSTLCRNTLKGFGGVIESPNFPNEYPEDQNCKWEIIVPTGNKINITFSHFQLETSNVLKNLTCAADFVEIKYASESNEESEESNEGFTTYGKYCGDKNPGLISLNSDHAKILFVSDNLLLGTGFRLEWQLFGCGGILSRRKGNIQSPNYPKSYPSNIQCNWLIQVDYGSSIALTFQKIDVEAGYSCRYDYVQVFNGLDETYNSLAKFCHHIKPITVTSSGNNMFVVFTADSSYQGKGFTASYSTIDTKCGGKLTAPEGSIYSPNYPKNYNPNDTCEWLIDIDENHVINLEFEDVDMLNIYCKENYVKVFDGPSPAYPVLATVCGSDKPNKTLTSSFNQVYVEFRSHSLFASKGFHLKYKKACGARIKTQGSGTIAMSRHYEFTDINLNCSWTIEAVNPSDHVALTISHMDSDQICDIYAYINGSKPLQIFNGEFSDSPLLGEYCGTKIPPTLFSDGSAMHINLNIPMDFFATYSVLDSHCGGSLISLDGYFSTPGYPKSYPVNQQCEWTLVISPGNHLTLNFIDFDIPSSENCNVDYLEIRQSNASGKLLGVYCGQSKPENITNVGSLWLLFKSSDFTTNVKGVYAEYALSTSNELTGSSGQIASPLYPRKLFTPTTYPWTWSITVKPGLAVSLTFKDFEMEAGDSSECFISFLKIYDGPDDTHETLGSFCGSNLPSPIKSSSNVITVLEETFSSRIGSKFLLEWSEVIREIVKPEPVKPKGCGNGETIDINSIKIFNLTSPGYPNGYAENIKCEWIFSTIQMNHLRVRIKAIDLKADFIQTKLCYDDYLAVYKKEAEDDWKLVKKLCNEYETETFDLPSLVKMVFFSGPFGNGSGFSAQISEGCGGYLTEPSGYIIFNNNTAQGFECQWNISVRTGRKIELTFEKMELNTISSSDCHNYLLIRNGKFPDSPILGSGKYCENNKPDKLKSISNHLYIIYTGSLTIGGFRIKYQEVSFECGGDIRLEPFDNFSEISSPNYPNIPEQYSECIWKIRAPPGESLQVDFVDRFDLSISKNCEKEYVEIRDGGTQYSRLINRFCSTFTPSTQFTTDNIMFVKFFTNTPIPKDGFKAKISIATCGGTIRGGNGEVYLQELKEFTQQVNCTWHLVGSAKHYLNLSFVDTHISSTSNCSQSPNYITLNDANGVPINESSEIGRYCGNQASSGIKSMTNEVTVNLVVKTKFEFKGFRLKFSSAQEECGGKINQESGVLQTPSYSLARNRTRAHCDWTIEVPEGRRITLTFEDPDKDNAAVRRHFIMVYNGDHSDSNIMYDRRPNLFKNGKSVVVQSSSNKIRIHFWCAEYTTHGLKIIFSSNEPTACVGDFNASSGLITQPVNMSKSYLCEWRHTSSRNQTLSLTVDLKTTNGHGASMCGFAMSSVIVENQNRDIITGLCQNTTRSVNVKSPFPITILKADTSHEELNFTVSFNTHNCGGIIDSEIGFISSPNFPNKPNKSIECAWLLKLPKEQRINVTGISSNLGSDCEKSCLSIYNGGLPTSPRIGKICGKDQVDNFISETNTLWIEYNYDESSGSTGFNLTFEPVIEGCGGLFHDKRRIIQTPGYAKDYPHNSECSWEIRSLPGYFIRLIFTGRFNLEQSDNCTKDFVEIWDWKDDQWVSLGRKCGRNAPSAIDSTSDRLKLLFRSNDKVAGAGFKARWEWHCGGTFEATSIPRYISSPGYPERYDQNLHCIYDIKPKDNAVLLLNFEDFDLQEGYSGCKYDNLTIKPLIYNSIAIPRSDIYFPARGYCGRTPPSDMRTTGAQRIEFTTDRFKIYNGRGFRFKYSTEGCGGDVKSASIIEYQFNSSTTLSSASYQPYIDCQWKISAPLDQVVVLVMVYLKTELEPYCYTQNVNIYDGLNMNPSAKLATFCGSIGEGTSVTSNSSNMLVKMTANPANYKGFKAFVYFTYGPAKGCGGTINLTETKTLESPNYLSDLDCTWKIIAPRDYQVKIQFTTINLPLECGRKYTHVYREDCNCAFIEVRDGGGPVSELISRLCNNTQTETLTTSWNTAYIRMLVIGRQNNVFRATLTPLKSLCGSSVLQVNTTKQILTSPNYPSSYPNSIKCIWKLETSISDIINIHFKDFDLSEAKINRCDEDKLEIIEDRNLQFVTEGLGPEAEYNGNSQRLVTYNQVYNRFEFCGKNDNPFEYYSKANYVVLSFRSVMDSRTRGRGFKLEYSLAGCNRNYSDVQGRLMYKANTPTKDCFINVTVPQNHTISLFFLSFYTIFNDDCNKTGIEIRDKNSSGTELLKACGGRLPDSVFSNTNTVWIHFYNHDEQILYYMYHDMVYTSSGSGRGCGGQFYNSQGRFTSPMYPGSYTKQSVCVWNIRVPTGAKAALKFTSFDIKGRCSANNVVVDTYNGGTTTGHMYCANDDPATLFSNSSFKVTYHSSPSNTGMGWVILFQAVTEESDKIVWFMT